MSDEGPADYVEYNPERAPGAPNPDYLPPTGEARDRVYAGHAKRMEEWAGYIDCYNRSYQDQKDSTSKLIQSRKRSRLRR